MSHLSLVLCLIRWTTASADTGTPAPDAQAAGVTEEARADPSAAAPAPVPATPPLPAPAALPLPAPAPPLAPSPLLPKETASYRVSFGLFGEVARATLTLAPEVVRTAEAGAPTAIIRAQGTGDGAVLGFGRSEKQLESEFDPATLAARSWTNARTRSGRLTVDGAVQRALGQVALLRKRTGEPDLAESFARGAAILDPLSFLLRLRMALPQATTRYEILDGRALWLAEVGAAGPDPEDPTLLRVEGHVDPVYWNGTPDPKRSRHRFALSFTRDPTHTPVRLVVPHGMGELRAELVRLERPQQEARALFALNPFCRGAGGTVCRGLLPLWARRPASR